MYKIKCFFLALILSQGVSFAEKPIPKLIQSTHNSIFLLEKKDSSLQQSPYGTGFLVKSNYMITHFHLIQSFLKMEDSSLETVVISQNDKPVDIQIKKVVAFSAEHDLALLEVSGAESFSTLTLSQTSLSKKDDLFIVAYPHREFQIINKIGHIETEEEDFMYFPANTVHILGSNGGPVLDSKGHVIGSVNTSNSNLVFFNKSSHLNQIIEHKTTLQQNTNKNIVVCHNLSNQACLEKSIEKLRKQAEQGEALSQYRYGIYTKEGWSWIVKAAKQGHTLSQVTLLDLEKQIHLEPAQIVTLLEDIARKGYAPAFFKLGIIYFGIQQYEEALKWMTFAEEKNYAPSIAFKAYMLFFGYGAEKNQAQAVNLLDLSFSIDEVEITNMVITELVEDTKSHNPLVNLTAENTKKIGELIEKREAKFQARLQ